MTHSTRSRALTVAAAVLTAVTTWTLAGPVAGIRIAANDEEVGVAQVAIVSLLAGLAAWVLFAVLDRFTSRATPIWTAIAATVLALSLTGPFGATSITAGITLACLHLLPASPGGRGDHLRAAGLEPDFQQMSRQRLMDRSRPRNPHYPRI
jgi:hypothetical protein